MSQSPLNSGNGNIRVSNRIASLVVGVAWLVTFYAAYSFEAPRLEAAIDSPAGVFGWFFSMDADWSISVLVLLSLPMILVVSRFAVMRPGAGSTQCKPDAQPASRRIQTAAAIGLFSLSLLSSASIGFRSISLTPIPGQSNAASTICFYELPPAYHDEFSYLLQARTFLAGRLSWPAMTIQPDLFHQVHVLNRPTTASRYFPWTGVWMTPFVAAGCPYFGHWLAGAIACVFFHRCLWRLMGFRWALIGGGLIAVSPGLAVFSNLLLAHQPTMLMLSAFLWAFLRMMHKFRVRDAVIGGTALSMAMLGRPMTAAGFALPFGIWLLIATMRQQFARTTQTETRNWSPVQVLMGIGIPLILGFVILAIMNYSITGRWMKSAYQLYTETWTPRHRYGFDNANIDPALPASKILKAYDDWAENLTVYKATSNVVQRSVYSLRWTLGIAALTFCLITALPNCLSYEDKRPFLLMCSVLAIHAVHIPYWYDGIMHWHYVFETAPLLIMLATIGLRNAYRALRLRLSARVTTLWLTSLILASLVPNWLDADAFWGTSRVTTAVREQTFSRVRFEFFRRLTTSDQIQHPALILVDEGSSNPQLSYIINPPELSGDVIVCRLPDNPLIVLELAREFSAYHLYTFDPESFQLEPL